MKLQSSIALLLGLGWMFVGIGPTFAQEKGHLYAHRGGSYEFEENTLSAIRGS
jgi:hypothetical protein